SPEKIMARALLMADQKVHKLEAQIEADKPKVLFADAVSASHTSILVGELAKLISQNGYKIGANRLFSWMRENGYLIKRKGSDWNMPTQRSMDLKLFEIKETNVQHADGHITVNKTPKVTGKGQQYFINKFLNQEYLTG
ncbi:phage antirepressor KilAC domain-containing protein, partial [Streptococcus pneumoniae]